MLAKQTAQEKLDLIPPETQYIVTKRVIKVPVSDEHLKDLWQLRLYAEKLVEHQLGDEVQLTGLKVKKPHLVHKATARLLRREPIARLYLTIKF